MIDTNDRLPVVPGGSEMDRLRRLFADVFGADVLDELPLRLDAMRQRRVERSHEWNRFASSRTPRS